MAGDEGKFVTSQGCLGESNHITVLPSPNLSPSSLFLDSSFCS